MNKVNDSLNHQDHKPSLGNGNSEKAHHVYDPAAAIELINRWLADESGYDEKTWSTLKKALDEDRISYRKLFEAKNRAH
jgi:hypothetical protein